MVTRSVSEDEIVLQKNVGYDHIMTDSLAYASGYNIQGVSRHFGVSW